MFTLLLSGCSENNTGGDALYTEFIGSWVGNMEYSMNNFRDNFSMFNNDSMTNRGNFSLVNITQLEFTKDTIYMTLTSEDGTQVISNLYKIEGDQLVLSFQFGGDRQRPDGMQPPNGWEPPTFDGNNRSFNDSQPFNFTRSFDGQPPQSSRSYTYIFNEDNTILYLDGSEFTKIN